MVRIQPPSGEVLRLFSQVPSTVPISVETGGGPGAGSDKEGGKGARNRAAACCKNLKRRDGAQVGWREQRGDGK